MHKREKAKTGVQPVKKRAEQALGEIRTIPQRSDDSEGRQNRPPTRFLILFGLSVVLLFFGIFVGWAGFAPLSSAAIAEGVVNVDNKSKTVQHKEGGIVKEIYVFEGKKVQIGDVLIELEDAKVKATYNNSKAAYLALTAKTARLQAEARGVSDISFPDWFLKLKKLAPVQNSIADELAAFRTGSALIEGKSDILQQKIARLNQEKRANGEILRAKSVQKSLITKEYQDLSRLAEKGLVRKTKIYALQRRISEIESEIVERRAAVNRNGKELVELQLQIDALHADRKAKAQLELNSAKVKLQALWNELSAAKDRLARQKIVSPLTGTVVNLQIHTVGGVLAAGQPLLDIVPENATLVVESRISLQDRDVVHAGLPAEIRFSAFNQRTSFPVKGKVRSVSADRLVNPQTNEAYYLALVDLEEPMDTVIEGRKIHTGMQAEVMILSGSKTVLGYLSEPIFRSFNRALRED